MEQAVRIGIYGASGSGKTYKARQLVKNCPRLIAFDPLGDFSGTGWKVAYSIKDLKKALVDNWKRDFKIAYRFTDVEQAESELNVVSNLLYAAQADYPKVPMLTFVVDELSLCYPKFGKCSSGFTNLACRGRHVGINLIGISQRIAQVNTNFRGNCTSSYFFRPADHVDIDTLGRIIGKEYLHKIRSMRNRDFFYVKDGQIKANF
jgi:hypothetical protein